MLANWSSSKLAHTSICVAVTVLSGGVSFAQNPAESPRPASEYVADLDRAREYMEAVRAQAFEDNPIFRRANELLIEARRENRDITQRRLNVSAEVNHLGLRKDYEEYRVYWSMATALDSFEAMMRDPEVAPVLDSFIVRAFSGFETNGEIAGLSEEQKDDARARFMTRLREQRERGQQRIEELNRTTSLTPEMIALMKEHLAISGREAIFETEYRMNKPAELVQAEERYNAIARELGTHYPGWNELSQEAAQDRQSMELSADEMTLGSQDVPVSDSEVDDKDPNSETARIERDIEDTRNGWRTVTIGAICAAFAFLAVIAYATRREKTH